MDFTACPLFGIQSKKMLSYLLKIPSKEYFKQDCVAKMVRPYIEVKPNGKKRLIEPPDGQLKSIQTNIKKAFYSLEIAPYVFSGVRFRSYVDNAKLHTGKRFLYKLDFTAFFPSIERETVYKFFLEKLNTAPDIAAILTNYTTIDIDIASCKDMDSINAFLIEKGVSVRSHLISGAPTSQILSYLVNVDMFDELYRLTHANGILMTVYVDDLFFSSDGKINYSTRKKIQSIISKYGYALSPDKEKMHMRYYPKKITGVIINKEGSLSIKNSLRRNIIVELMHLKSFPDDEKSKLRLRGLVTAARQVVPGSYPAIHKFVFK